ncbi:ABA4-like family protein [Flavobacteriaceae bacterium]|nr:ABA4-like family protein [Flavobacteriaceae bacterium]
MTVLFFNLCNTVILVAWAAILFFPKSTVSKPLISFPWVPLGISFFYSYFIIVSGGLAEADFSSLEGILVLFQNATPESAAAGWLHYLAFDFWVGTWIVRHSQKKSNKTRVYCPAFVVYFYVGPRGDYGIQPDLFWH